MPRGTDDVAAVRADDALIEQLRAGVQPPTGQVAATLTAWRTECQEGT